MAKFLLKARYAAEGLQGVLKEGGSSRRAVVDGLTRDVGGSVESFYFAFGEDDAYIVCELPDNRAAATLAMVASASGRVSVTTVPLLSVEDVDAIAAGKKPAYTPPGS
jgi:uncharacterized protein with GYD domain